MAKKSTKKKRRSAAPPVSHKREYLAMAFISLLCLLVFGRNITFDGFLIDIPQMIFNNPHIMTGVSWENIWWSFTQPNLALYQPLPNLAFMLESHLFGGWPGGYHAMTLVWHIACMCLFIWVMMRLTNNFVVVFSATLLMAIHPVQILTVSQIAPRNEIMQAFFMLLSIWAYQRYVKSGSYKAYGCSVIAMCMGVLCKQIIVMLPVALLLLDYWPLQRVEISFCNLRQSLRSVYPRIKEKIPFFLVSFFGAFLAFYGKTQYGQIKYHVEQLTIPDAIYFIITGYVRYLGHLIYPLRPSYFEVYSEEQQLYFFVLSAIVLTVITALTLIFVRKRPYLFVGWFWFVAFLFPVSGVVRYMLEAIALRYLYIPAMGVYIAVCMCLFELIQNSRKIEGEEEQSQEKLSDTAAIKMPRWYWTGIGIVTAILALLAFWENGLFRNTETIAMQMQEVSGDRSAIGHNALAVIRVGDGRLDEAAEHFRRSVEIQPKNYVFRYYYGSALYKQGKYPEVVKVMAPAAASVPDATEYLELYALGLMATGQYSEARKQLKTALEIDPNTVSLLQNLAYCLILQGHYTDAQPYLEKGLRIDPENPALLQLKEMAASVVDHSAT